MLFDYLLNFLIVIAVQLVFFFTHLRLAGKGEHLVPLLLKGALLGLPFGVIFDLFIGKYVGIFNYHIGFESWFLIINGILSYGFMMSNVFLLHNHTVPHTILWSIGLGITYEITNFFFPVWEWTFGTPIFEYAIVILCAYMGLTLLMMLLLRAIYREKFALIPF